MLAGLMENNYEKMWPFDKFFEHSSYISSLKFVNVMNLDTCQIIELPFENNVKLNDLKEKIEKETKIEKASQLLIYNNLLIDSLVTENQTIDTYPLMDKQHPCILFSLETSLTCDNLEIIKSSNLSYITKHLRLKFNHFSRLSSEYSMQRETENNV